MQERLAEHPIHPAPRRRRSAAYYTVTYPLTPNTGSHHHSDDILSGGPVCPAITLSPILAAGTATISDTPGGEGSDDIGRGGEPDQASPTTRREKGAEQATKAGRRGGEHTGNDTTNCVYVEDKDALAGNMAQQRHFAIVIEDRGNEEAAATIHNRPHADATNFVASNDPPPNIRTIIPKKLAVERAESEIVGHAELLEAVLHDIDSFYTQTGQIATMRASLKVAVASCHAGQSFNQHLPPKSMLLAARYCDFENSIDPILAGNLARLNRLDLAQAGNASCGQPGIECINAQKLSKSQETIQVLKKEVERMGEDTKHLLSEIAILEDLVF